MATATLPNFPTPLTNSYFYSSDRILSTEGGQAWVSAFRDFIQKFLHSRFLELKPGGVFSMVTSSYSVNPEIQKYQLKDEDFYQGLYDLMLRVFTSHGV